MQLSMIPSEEENMNNPYKYLGLAMLFASISTMSSAAGFGDFINSLSQKLQPTQSGSAGKQEVGATATGSYCKNLFSIASINNKAPIDEAIISEEFKLSPKDFFDEAFKALYPRPKFSSYTFPSTDFYQGEFETDKINVLFNLLLSYPSSQYAAALISESRKTSKMPQYDHQAKIDATAALAILHFYMKDKSISPNRWKDLVNSFRNEEHYTANVIWARLLKSGEMGSTDVSQALSLAKKAGELSYTYSHDSGYRTMSKRNYQFNSHQTLYEILVSNPALPQRSNYDQFIQKFEANKNGPGLDPEIKAKLTPELDAIDKSSKSAVNKAEEMLGAAKKVSLAKAEKGSLDSALRTRTSDSTEEANIDEHAMAAIARQFEHINKLDENQKKLFSSALVDAHESGDRAIAMMPTMMLAMMNLMMKGFETMPTILPYSKRLQKSSDDACTVISRWDHAAEVIGQNTDDDRSSLAALVADSVADPKK